MIETFLLVALPYIALVVCVAGTFYRIKTASLTYTALSSQFLESKSLLWGSLPWHIGISLILLGHFLALLFPGPWHALMNHRPFLLTVEVGGMALSFAAIVGLLILIVRRVTSARVQSVTTSMDLFVLALLLAQIVIGLGVAAQYRWGALWSTGTAVPYIWSILLLQPDPQLVADLPILMKAHIVTAWLIIALIPFSRLIHMFALPVHYLMRAPQQVIWTNPRKLESAESAMIEHESRRYFIKGMVGIAAGGALLSVGAMDKVFRFFFGPRLSRREEAEIMATRLKRLQATASQKQLELERQQTNYILVESLSKLNDTKGKYFIDYEMRPALAFKGSNGLPILLSAKCTHLGCTVGNDVTDGKILCPCHVSFFSIETGQPDANAPAKAPLPKVPWVLMDTKGAIVASCDSAGRISGNTALDAIKNTNVYITKNLEEARS
jgi:nitrate reductase gamma subunit